MKRTDASPSHKTMRKIIRKFFVLKNSAQCHTASHTRETFWELKFEVCNHPTCSPDLASSDFHLSGPLNGALVVINLKINDKLKK
jgi:hypothetical protein